MVSLASLTAGGFSRLLLSFATGDPLDADDGAGGDSCFEERGEVEATAAADVCCCSFFLRGFFSSARFSSVRLSSARFSSAREESSVAFARFLLLPASLEVVCFGEGALALLSLASDEDLLAGASLRCLALRSSPFADDRFSADDGSSLLSSLLSSAVVVVVVADLPLLSSLRLARAPLLGDPLSLLSASL